MSEIKKPLQDRAEACGCGGGVDRRRVLQGMVGAAAGAAIVSSARAATTPDAMPPQVGDFLVTALGKDPLTPERVRLNAAGTFEAWPQSPDGVARRGAGENQVQLFRYDPNDLLPEVRALSADGVVAISAICTHQGCQATEWEQAERVLVCPCHGSRFDPKKGGALLSGPALRKLPQLAIKIDNGKLVVAGPFDSRVGGDQAGADEH